MEVGTVCLDRVPTDEMRYGQAVSTLIDITRSPKSGESIELVQEESGDGQAQGKFPFRGFYASVEWLCA